MTTRLFTWYFRFQNTCNSNTFLWVSRWISVFYITQSSKECRWSPFYPPITKRTRISLPNCTDVLCEFLKKNSAQKKTVHRASHPTVTNMTVVNFWVNVLQRILLTNNLRINILYRKVIAIEKWFNLYEKMAIKRIIWLKLLTLAYFKRVFF